VILLLRLLARHVKKRLYLRRGRVYWQLLPEGTLVIIDYARTLPRNAKNSSGAASEQTKNPISGSCYRSRSRFLSGGAGFGCRYVVAKPAPLHFILRFGSEAVYAVCSAAFVAGTWARTFSRCEHGSPGRGVAKFFAQTLASWPILMRAPSDSIGYWC